MAHVLVVGAGMAGLSAARRLQGAGVAVRVVDKGRAVGGRMATRRSGAAAFDHGAQHISARTEAFAREMERLVGAGVARVWLRTHSLTHPERGIEPRFAGVGGMRRIPEALATDLDVTTGITVGRIDPAAADAVVLTPPLPQSAAILAAGGLELPTEVAAIEYDAALAVMAALDAPAGLPDGHLAPADGPVAWMADNQHKGVSKAPSLTIHSSGEFAARYLEEEPSAWMPLLLATARAHHAGRVVDAIPHRWRYSQPKATLEAGAIPVPAPMPVVLAGEALAGARVEGAYTSGLAAAAMVLELLG